MEARKKSLLTENNYFQYGRIRDYPTAFFSKLDLFQSSKSKGMNGLQTAIIAAKKIHAQAEAQGSYLNLCVSGGIDSEVMLLSFLEAGIDFEATVMRFKEGFNDFDIFNVIEFCQSKKIKLNIVELDILDFLESGKHLFYGSTYQCQSPQIAAHLWLLDQVNGFPVLSGNFIYPNHTENGIFYIGLPGDLHCVYFRYFEISKKAGIPWFLMYTPELTEAFFQTEIIQKQFQCSISSQIPFTYITKCEVYRQAGFDVYPRKDKFTGFEKVRDFYDGQFQTSYGIKFNELFRAPLEKLNPLPQEFLQLVGLPRQEDRETSQAEIKP